MSNQDKFLLYTAPDGARRRGTETDMALAAQGPAQGSHRFASGRHIFDDEGYFDPSAFDRHQRASAELALAPLITEPGSAATVVDAASRFVA